MNVTKKQGDEIFLLFVAAAALLGFAIGAITCSKPEPTADWNPDPHEWIANLETAPVAYPSSTTIMRGGVTLRDDIVVGQFSE